MKETEAIVSTEGQEVKSAQEEKDACSTHPTLRREEDWQETEGENRKKQQAI